MISLIVGVIIIIGLIIINVLIFLQNSKIERKIDVAIDRHAEPLNLSWKVYKYDLIKALADKDKIWYSWGYLYVATNRFDGDVYCHIFVWNKKNVEYALNSLPESIVQGYTYE